MHTHTDIDCFVFFFSSPGRLAGFVFCTCFRVEGFGWHRLAMVGLLSDMFDILMVVTCCYLSPVPELFGWLPGEGEHLRTAFWTRLGSWEAMA